MFYYSSICCSHVTPVEYKSDEHQNLNPISLARLIVLNYASHRCSSSLPNEQYESSSKPVHASLAMYVRFYAYLRFFNCVHRVDGGSSSLFLPNQTHTHIYVCVLVCELFRSKAIMRFCTHFFGQFDSNC